jgi:urease accessory protein
MPRAISHLHAGQFDAKPSDTIMLAHDERHLRRKLLKSTNGTEILVDFPHAVALDHGDVLMLDDDRLVQVVAADEPLYEVTARDPLHLAKLCWHLGNRHLPAEIREDRILIARDHVIRDMLLGLGATVREIMAPFSPERGAYHGHGHQHDHGHPHPHPHD